MIKLKTINKDIIKPIKMYEEDKRPIKGGSICSTCYGNIALIASIASGKTNVLFNILKKCAGKKTKIIAFVSTLFNDNNWNVIKKWCKKNKIQFVGHTSIYEDGNDLLGGYVNEFTEKAKQREKKEDMIEENKMIPITVEESLKICFNDDSDDEEEETCQYPETIMIFDDLANEIRDRNYENLLKKSRHFHILTITSSQDLKDITPASRAQMRIWILFRNINPERLQNIYDAISPNIAFNKFKSIYEHATKDKYNFLYINHREENYRKCFDKQYLI